MVATDPPPPETAARTPAAVSVPGASGWFAVAPVEDVGADPREVVAGGHRFVAFRPAPGAPAAVVAARCPHRLVRLDRARVEDGRLECPYHGWQFDASGRCVLVPSAPADSAVPARAHLDVPWGVREQDGQLWIAPVDPARSAAASDMPEPPDMPQPPAVPTPDELLTNVHPVLDRGWHPLALSGELPEDGAPLDVRLLGRPWSVRRSGPDLVVEPRPYALAERFGLVWIAPSAPVADLLDCADDDDPAFVGAWLPPERSASAAGVLAENFLDVAHFPFVHAGTFGAAEERYVPPFDVYVEGAGLTSVQEQWFDNPEDPGVASGVRPVRQRRRATYRYRAPFQLSLRLEELDAGAVKTILFVLQPEDADATRIYTKMVLHGIGGVARPALDVVATEVAFEQAVLAEDLELQAAMTVTGLPLRLRDELHVRSDRAGVALRRIWRHLLTLP